MKIVGNMLVRNEAWVVGLALGVALRYCDEVVVFDHLSTDATPDIIAQLTREHPGRRITLISDPDPTWREMDFRDAMLRAARERRATHVCVIDADEALTANLVDSARDLIADSGRTGLFPMVPMISPWAGLSRRRTDPAFRSGIGWSFKDHPSLSYRPRHDGYHFHSRTPRGLRVVPCPADGGVFHLQFASLRRLRVKSVWYKMLELVRWPGRRTPQQLNQQYDWAIEARPELAPVPDHWQDQYRDLIDRFLDLDAEPWQTAEIKSMVGAYGMGAFRGLELHGVL